MGSYNIFCSRFFLWVLGSEMIETKLKAARLAWPGIVWYTDGISVFHEPDNNGPISYFAPETNYEDRWRLWEGLIKYGDIRKDECVIYDDFETVLECMYAAVETLTNETL